MRSSVGGCVENKREKPTAENGFGDHHCGRRTGVPRFCASARSVRHGILFSAEARASGSPVSKLPSSSASYSRVREMGHSGSKTRQSARESPLSNCADRTEDHRNYRGRLADRHRNTSARIAQIGDDRPWQRRWREVRMSWLYTCISSWPSTPRSSRALRICRMPRAQQTAACRSLRPVAKAFGLHGRGDSVCWHRLAGLGAQFTHDLVGFPGLPVR